MATFRARARALDLLGRQQIANVPSAVNELFKNAYDAYARHVDADLIQPENLLIIRDDGVGMTLSDFEDKWLVLGTESKFSSLRSSGYRPPGMAARFIAGEKGIGRLAIGMLGPQALVLTRARREDGLHELVVSFVNWSAFAVPDIDLTEIQVPILTLDPGQLPTTETVRKLVKDFEKGLRQACRGKKTEQLEDLVYEELELFDPNPAQWLEQLGEPDFENNVSGTQFYIQPVSNIVWDSIKPEQGRYVSELVRHLLGFTDVMTKEPEKVPIELGLRLHRGPGDFDDLIEDSGFWSQVDFPVVDHEVHGFFDKFGHFDGSVRIFDNGPVEHKIPNRESRGHVTECGPFEFHLGYVQGNASESRLDPPLHTEYSRRLDRLAGVYVFRDGLRVLPYGEPEHDWLRIEERRNKGFSHYFFSYRRMFGCVNITRNANPELRDKAGREGFQQNRAYTQLRDLIVGVLAQLAADFFRDRDESTKYQLGRKENQKKNRAWERHQNSKSERLKAFRERLRDAEKLVDEENLATQLQNEFVLLNSELQALKGIEASDDRIRGLIGAETKYSDRLRGIVSTLSVTKPRGVALGPTLSRSFASVSDKRDRLLRDIIEPAQLEVEALVRAAAKEANTDLDQRLRVTTIVTQQADRSMREVRRDSTKTKSAAQDLALRISTVCNEITMGVDQRIRDAILTTNTFDYKVASTESVDLLLSDSRNQIALATEFFDNGLITIRELLESIIIEWDPSSGLFSSLDISESLDSEIGQLQETAEQDLELAQMGMSIDIINHEFLSSVTAVRKGLRALESWTLNMPDLSGLYEILQTNFSHLENFLQLFTPLRKRFNAEKTQISGTLIRDYLRSVFFEKLKEMNIELEFSKSFLDRKVLSYASVVLPAFVNLVDNAIFWLQGRPSPRRIVLDVDGGAWIVSDNGPGIGKDYQRAVFQAGFTTKPGGRGLGLYIAREVLRRNRFDLSIDAEPLLGAGITFRIGALKQGDAGQSDDS